MRKMYYFILLSFAITSCEMVGFPEPEISKPVFYANGSIGGKSLDWIAGKETYFMHTNVISENGLKYYEGLLAKDSCRTLCNNSIRMRILENGLTDQPSQAFAIGSRLINTTKERSKMQTIVTKNVVAKGIIEQKSETIINGNPVITGSTLTLALGPKTIKYTTQFGEKVFITMESNVSPKVSKVVFPSLIIEVSEKVLRIKADNSALSSLDWGNGTKNNILELPVASASRVQLAMTNKNGDSFNYTFEFKLANVAEAFSINLGIVAEVTKIIEAENPTQRHSLLIEYADEAGNVYSSKDIEQTEKANVIFTMSDEYVADAKGGKTRKVDALINCLLRNERLNTDLEVKDLHLSFGFGYGQ